MEHTLPLSTRKFIRSEKARIRAQFLDTAKRKELIGQLYSKFSAKAEDLLVAPKEVKKEVVEKEPKAKTQKKEKAGVKKN